MINRPTLRNPSLPGGTALPRVRLPERGARSRFWLSAAAIVALAAGLTLVLYLYLVPNSQISETNVRIAALRAEKIALTRENARLVQEITAYTDLAYIKRRAKELGMGPPQRYMYLYVNTGAATAAPTDSLSPEAASLGSPKHRWQQAQAYLLHLLRRLRLPSPLP